MHRQADLGRGHAARRPRLRELPIRCHRGVLIEILRLASLMNHRASVLYTDAEYNRVEGELAVPRGQGLEILATVFDAIEVKC
jgi:hypothetical protein